MSIRSRIPDQIDGDERGERERRNDPVNTEIQVVREGGRERNKKNPRDIRFLSLQFTRILLSLPSEALQIMKNGHCFMNEGNKRREFEIGEKRVTMEREREGEK